MIKIGIYKITSPSGKIYIGQSVNVSKRINGYKSGKIHSFKNQTRLKNSIIKHGIDAHKFEIITECNESELNNLERYYQDLYDSCGEMGLNCILTKSNGRSGKLSEDMKSKIGKKGELHHMYGKVHTEESKQKISETKKGKPSNRKGAKHTEESIKKMAKARFGKKASEETKRKMSQSGKGKRTGANHSRAIKVIRLSDGKIYETVSEAVIDNKIPSTTLRRYLNGTRENKTNFKYLDNN